MTGLAIIRPGLYALCVEAGTVRLQGTKVTPIPKLSGDVDPGGAVALITDMLLLSAGILPPDLMIGVPCE